PEKTTAPAKPSIEKLEVILVEDPSSGGSFGCPDSDGLKMRVAVPDPGPAFALFYFGATPAETLANAHAEIAATACSSGAGYDFYAVTGESVGRRRANNGGFSRSGRYCVAVALMDLA